MNPLLREFSDKTLKNEQLGLVLANKTCDRMPYKKKKDIEKLNEKGIDIMFDPTFHRIFQKLSTLSQFPLEHEKNRTL